MGHLLPILLMRLGHKTTVAYAHGCTAPSPTPSSTSPWPPTRRRASFGLPSKNTFRQTRGAPSKKYYFHTMTQGDLSVEDYGKKMKVAADKLRDVGHPVTEATLVLNLLRGINKKFSNTADFVAGQKNITFTEALDQFQLKLAGKQRSGCCCYCSRRFLQFCWLRLRLSVILHHNRRPAATAAAAPKEEPAQWWPQPAAAAAAADAPSFPSRPVVLF